MDKYIEMDFPEFKYSEIAKDVHNLFNDISTLTLELLNCYTELNIALNEALMCKDIDLDSYIVADGKIIYLLSKIPDLIESETILYTQNSDLLPYLEKFIKKVYEIKVEDLSKFSMFDSYIDPNFQSIKNNFTIIRMLRAIKYYSEYMDNYFEYIRIPYANEDSDTIRDMINYDFADIETINTLSLIKTTYQDDEHGDFIYNKYQTLFMFTNPLLEHFYLSNGISTVHPFFMCSLDESSTKRVNEKIVKTLTSIQKNKIVNLGKNNKIINSKLTIKQVLDILFHFNGNTSGYDNRFEMLKNDYINNVEEIGVLFAYLQQAYVGLDENAVIDLDVLLHVMCNEEITTTLGEVRLSPKVVNHFFNKEGLLQEKAQMRTRTNDSNSKEDE